MKKIFFLLFIIVSSYGQNTESVSEVELCRQIQTVLNYLKDEKELKNINFRFNSKIGNGWNYEMYFSTEYVAYELGIEKEKVFEFDKNKTYPIFKKLEDIKLELNPLLISCVKRKRKPNTELSKLDKDNLLINVTTNRVGKEGSSGIVYLFFFENEKITEVCKNFWIE